MNLNRIAGLFCIAAICSLTAFSPAVWAFQNMVCSSSGKTDQVVCTSAQQEKNGVVKITCLAPRSSEDTSPAYTCAKATRDWGQSSSPYAHTSTLWRCANGSREIFIFAADFDSDALRCDIVCGKCPTTWRAKP